MPTADARSRRRPPVASRPSTVRLCRAVHKPTVSSSRPGPARLLRPAAVRDLDAHRQQPPLSGRAAGDPVEVRCRTEEQRAAVGTAEHACEHARARAEVPDDLPARLHPHSATVRRVGDPEGIAAYRGEGRRLGGGGCGIMVVDRARAAAHIAGRASR
jgi:hypothetical protein